MRMHKSGCTRADAQELMQELSEPIRCAKFRARERMRESLCERADARERMREFGCESGCKSGYTRGFLSLIG